MLRAIGALGLAVLALAGAGPRRAQDPPRVLTIGGPATHQAIPPGFLGLSFEYWAVPQYAGANPRHINPVFLQLIRNLAGGSAPVLRIGGVSTDNTWWPLRGATTPTGIGRLKVWATRAPDGAIHVVVINEGASAKNVAVRLAGSTTTGTLERLEAPSITARGRVTLAGQTFGAATGLPIGAPRTTSVTPTKHGYVMLLPAASAAMLTVG